LYSEILDWQENELLFLHGFYKVTFYQAQAIKITVSIFSSNRLKEYFTYQVLLFQYFKVHLITFV